MTKGSTMSILKSDADRARAQNANLLKHYRAIGPAAVAAAVAAIKKRTQTPAPRPAKA
jgi:hypothetical protein